MHPRNDAMMTRLTSHTPAQTSQLSSLGLRTSIRRLTAMYSAYAPPYASPNTSSPLFQWWRSSSPRPAADPSCSIVPLNSTPSVAGA